MFRICSGISGTDRIQNFSIVALDTGTLQAFYQQKFKNTQIHGKYSLREKMFLKVVANSKEEAALNTGTLQAFEQQKFKNIYKL